MLADLDDWFEELGVSEVEISPKYDAARKEHGIASQLLSALTAKVFPLSAQVEPAPHRAGDELGRLRFGEYAVWLLTQPEPEPDAVPVMVQQIRDAIPNLRAHFGYAASVGPQYRHGGRKRKVKDPIIRDQIRERIKQLRDSDRTLEGDIYKQVAREFGTSPASIKRIRLEKSSRKSETKKNDKI